jgi:hypothetical protein
MDKIDSSARRQLLKRGAVAGAAMGLAALISDNPAAAAEKPTAGDVAILKFLAAAELVETDLWTQYSQLAVQNPAFRAAMHEIDPAIVRWTEDTARDENSHAIFINAYLASIGEDPVDLGAFETLPSAPVIGVPQVGRLTNLMHLTINTSWYLRYRTPANPDFGSTPAQIVNIVGRPAVPTSNSLSAADVQTIAQTAAFHFCTIEQGGTSLYASLLPKVSSPDVLRILIGIGPVEAIHFGVFQTALDRIAPLTSSDGKLTFPDLRGGRLDSRSVMPAPAKFLARHFPHNSVVRPAGTAAAGAVAAATGLVNSGLFAGQSQAFFNAVVALATAADAATQTV